MNRRANEKFRTKKHKKEKDERNRTKIYAADIHLKRAGELAFGDVSPKLQTSLKSRHNSNQI